MALQWSFILLFGKASVNFLWIVSTALRIMVSYQNRRNKR